MQLVINNDQLNIHYYLTNKYLNKKEIILLIFYFLHIFHLFFGRN